MFSNTNHWIRMFRLFTLVVGMEAAATLAWSQQAQDASPPNADHTEHALHNVLKLSDRVWSGGEPVGDQAFREIAALGAKVVVSVDGAKLDIEAARKAGLRYIHIPVGYDGISVEAAASLARLMKDVEGPFYFHCHHGIHRGPAAAAAACIASGDLNREAAVGVLERAGTSKDYEGLWRSVREYQLPSPTSTLPELKEVAEVDSIVALMSDLDRAFDRLKECRTVEWTTPADQPDVVPSREALLVKEGLREAGRIDSGEWDGRFRAWLAEAEGHATILQQALERGEKAQAEEMFKLVEASCKQCHGQYRN